MITEQVILSRVAQAIRRNIQYDDLRVDDQSCYLVAAPAYVDGISDFTVQVAPGGDRPDGAGEGGQMGGGYCAIKGGVIIASFVRVNLDKYGSAEIALADQQLGILQLKKAYRDLFRHTYLGTGVLVEPMRYEGATTPQWAAQGVIRVDVRFSTPFVETFDEGRDGDAQGLTLTEVDFVGVSAE